MNNTYTAVIKDEGNCWIGWIQEVPGVNCQENTYQELIDTLKITLSEALEFIRSNDSKKPIFTGIILLGRDSAHTE